MASGKCPCSLGFHPCSCSPQPAAETSGRTLGEVPAELHQSQNCLRPTSSAEIIPAGASGGPWEQGEAVLALRAAAAKLLQQRDLCVHCQGAAGPAAKERSASPGRWRGKRCDALPPALSPGSPAVGRPIPAGSTASRREGAFLQRGW